MRCTFWSPHLQGEAQGFSCFSHLSMWRYVGFGVLERFVLLGMEAGWLSGPYSTCLEPQRCRRLADKPHVNWAASTNSRLSTALRSASHHQWTLCCFTPQSSVSKIFWDHVNALSLHWLHIVVPVRAGLFIQAWPCISNKVTSTCKDLDSHTDQHIRCLVLHGILIDKH